MTYLAIDLEMTGLNVKRDHILEIGALRMENGRPSGEFSALINPHCTVPETITQLTGITQEMAEAGEELDIKVFKANGAAECKKALLLMKVGRLPEDFIEGMACEGGCVGGPSAFKDQMLAKKSRDTLIKEADSRGINENLKNYDETSFSMHRK